MQKDYSKYQEYANHLSPSDFIEAVERLKLQNPQQYSKQLVDWRKLLKDELLIQLETVRPQWRTKNVKSLLREVDNKPSMKISPISTNLGLDVVFYDYATQESGHGVIELDYMMHYHNRPSRDELDRYILEKGIERGYPRIALNPNNEVQDDNKQSYYKINTRSSFPEKRRYLLNMLVEQGVLNLQGEDSVTFNNVNLQKLVNQIVDYPQRVEAVDVVEKFLQKSITEHPKFQLEFEGKIKRNGTIIEDTFSINEVKFQNQLLTKSLAEALVKFGHYTAYAEYHNLEQPKWKMLVEKTAYKDSITQEKKVDVQFENLFDMGASRMCLPFHKNETPKMLINFTNDSAEYVTKNGKVEKTSIIRAEANAKEIAPRTVLTVSGKEAEKLKENGIHSCLLCNQYIQPNSTKQYEYLSNKQLIDSFQSPSYNQLSSLKDKDNKNLTNGLALRRSLFKAMGLAAELHIDVNSINLLSKQKSSAAVIQHGDELLANEKLLAIIVGTALAVKPVEKTVMFFDSDTQKTESLIDFVYNSKKISNPDAFLHAVSTAVEANQKLQNFIEQKVEEINFRLSQHDRKDINLSYQDLMILRDLKLQFSQPEDAFVKSDPESFVRIQKAFSQLLEQVKPSLMDNKVLLNELISPAIKTSTSAFHIPSNAELLTPIVPKISEHNSSIGVFAYHKINELVHAWSRKPERLKALPFENFVKERGLEPKLIERFGLGFLDLPMKDEGVGVNFFENAKQAVSRELYKGLSIGEQSLDKSPPALAKVELYDAQNVHTSVHKRIVFPVRDVGGNVIAFGGREIPNFTPKNEKVDTGSKYYNSAQGWNLREGEGSSPERVNLRKETNQEIQKLWRKKLTFYGMYESMPFIQQEKSAIVVEGYMDCIAAHKFGVENTVATMGTALDADKMNELYRYTNNATIMLDGDEAGLNGMIQTLNNVLNEKAILENNGTLPLQPHRQLSFVHLPFNLDPDEFAHKYGAEALKSEIQQAYSLPEFIIKAAYHRVFEIEHKNIGLSTLERVQEKKGDIEQIARFEAEVKTMLSNLVTEPSDKVSADKIAFNNALKQETITLCESAKRLLMVNSTLAIKCLSAASIERGVDHAVKKLIDKGQCQDYDFLQKMLFSESYLANKEVKYESMAPKVEHSQLEQKVSFENVQEQNKTYQESEGLRR